MCIRVTFERLIEVSFIIIVIRVLRSEVPNKAPDTENSGSRMWEPDR